MCVCDTLCVLLLSHRSYLTENKKLRLWIFIFAIEWRHFESCNPCPLPTFSGYKIWNVNIFATVRGVNISQTVKPKNGTMLNGLSKWTNKIMDIFQEMAIWNHYFSKSHLMIRINKSIIEYVLVLNFNNRISFSFTL